MSRPRPLLTFAALATVLALSACGGGGSSAPTSPTAPAESATSAASPACALLKDDPGWHGDNRARLDAMITEHGECGGDADVTKGAALALFDWDNTVVKNDIGDAMTYWMLANGKVRQPADSDWSKVSPFFTADAVQALNSACGALAAPGEVLPTDSEAGVACADEILSIYGDSETSGGQAAFEGFNARRMEPAYAFAAQLLHGWTTQEVKEMAAKSREQNLAAPEGAVQKVGSKEVTGWVRYYDQITDLIAVMQANGIDVRVISASAEPVAEVWGEALKINTDRVMGVVTDQADGKLTSTLAVCGGEAATITYIEGKRCRVNEEVFGITGAQAWEPAPADKRQIFGAGDSDTDISFMVDATALRLAINRNKTELMCNAYANLDGNWIVNPMFIKPKDQRTELYPCSTAGLILPDGSRGPLLDDKGNPVPDQKDTVF